MPVPTDYARRTALCEWLTAHGIEPNTVPVDGDLTIIDTDDGRAIRVETMVRTDDGRLMLNDRGTDEAREIRTVPLVVEPPEWWTPYEKPTREQLLTTVERVRKLHHPTSVVAAAEAGIEPDCAVCGPNAWPCPTYRALDGEDPQS